MNFDMSGLLSNESYDCYMHHLQPQLCRLLPSGHDSVSGLWQRHPLLLAFPLLFVVDSHSPTILSPLHPHSIRIGGIPICHQILIQLIERPHICLVNFNVLNVTVLVDPLLVDTLR